MNLCTNGSFQMPQKKRGMNGTKTTHQIKRSGGTNESTMNLQPMATMAKREHETGLRQSQAIVWWAKRREGQTNKQHLAWRLHLSFSLTGQKINAPRGLAQWEREKKKKKRKMVYKSFFFHPLPSTLAYKKLPLSPSQLRCNVVIMNDAQRTPAHTKPARIIWRGSSGHEI